jgi:hypothetical protein
MNLDPDVTYIINAYVSVISVSLLASGSPLVRSVQDIAVIFLLVCIEAVTTPRKKVKSNTSFPLKERVHKWYEVRTS